MNMRVLRTRLAPVCMAVFLLAGGCSKNRETSGVQQIKSANELKSKMDVSNILVIHTLDAEHYAKGHIPGAVNIDYERMNPQMLPENKDLPLAFYCAGPMCPVGERAAAKAASWGYTAVWVYKGGISDWRAAGMDLATGAD